MTFPFLRQIYFFSLFLLLWLSGSIGISSAEEPLTAGKRIEKQVENITQKNLEAPQFGKWGVETIYMDKAVKPGDDFYRYVNGKWMDTFILPADRSSYTSFTILGELSEKRVRDIVRMAADSKEKQTPVKKKIGDLYNSFMDVETIEKKGISVLKEDLTRIAEAKTHEDVITLMADPTLGLVAPYELYIHVDSKDVERYVPYLTQSGLGLPERDYYLSQDKRFVEFRKKYKEHIQKMFSLAGIKGGAEKAKAILSLETKLAKVQWPSEKRREALLTYNPMTLEELKSYAPGIPWKDAFAHLKMTNQTKLVLNEKDALKASAEIFKNTPVPIWQDYMTFHFLSSMASFLPEALDKEDFNFYQHELNGTPTQKKRWKRGVSLVDYGFDQAIGHIYVDKYFSPKAKREMENLVNNLITVYQKRINNVPWMSEETKKKALEKLSLFTPKIGYPKKWRKYSKLKLKRNDLISNVKNVRQFRYNYMANKLGKPVDHEEWFMSPQTVNAYYSPALNQIVFPAAILQPPFFNPKADPAVNYAGIGAVIGHEMSHGFDDQGRKYDGKGYLREWWNEEDKKRFKQRAAALVKQYQTYEPVKGYPINGSLTLGENIGDLGGLTLAYDAYRLSLKGKKAPIIDGLTGDQRFFLSWAQIWRSKIREKALINRIKTDPHSPGKYRVNGIVRNLNSWYKAFNIKEGDKLYIPPEKRVQIW